MVATIAAPASPEDRIGFRPRQAAELLSISERLLWELTKRGKIRAVRIGRAVIYRRADLESFLADRAV